MIAAGASPLVAAGNHFNFGATAAFLAGGSHVVVEPQEIEVGRLALWARQVISVAVGFVHSCHGRVQKKGAADAIAKFASGHFMLILVRPCDVMDRSAPFRL
jgi:hypothetical protein